jgi:hypothetical protein
MARQAWHPRQRAEPRRNAAAGQENARRQTAGIYQRKVERLAEALGKLEERVEAACLDDLPVEFRTLDYVRECLPEGGERMRKSRFTGEQMVGIIREADRDPVGEVAKRHGIREATIYTWASGSASCGRRMCAVCASWRRRTRG